MPSSRRKSPSSCSAARACSNSLAQERRLRYFALAEVCRDIESASSENPLTSSSASTDPRLRKLDELMWTYLRLLTIEESLQRFLETERREDLPALVQQAEGEIAQLRAEVERLKAAGDNKTLETRQRFFSSRQDRLDVLHRRLERSAQARENVALVVAEQERLDQQIKLIRADAVAMKNAGALTERIDATVEHLDQTNKWLAEMDDFKDLVGDLPQTEARLGFSAPPSPPPLTSAGARPKARGRISVMTPTPTDAAPSRLPLRGWALELARRWNSATYSLYVLHGNIYDVFPVLEGAETRFVSLKQFLARRIFPTRAFLLYYDIGDGLTFGAPEMQKRFFEWLEIYDQVENTSYARAGLPREFTRLAPLLRRFFLHAAQERSESITLHIDFPEKIIPASPDASTSLEERMALVTLLKWAASAEMRKLDLGVIVVTETAAKLAGDLLQNPHVAQVELLLPEAEDRLLFLQKGPATAGRALAEWSDFSAEALAGHLSGLNLARIQHLLAEALGNGARVTAEHVARGKKRLIEEYCQGLVRFKSPKPGLSLDAWPRITPRRRGCANSRGSSRTASATCWSAACCCPAASASASRFSSTPSPANADCP